MTGADGVVASVSELRAVELFAGLTVEQLTWLGTQGTRLELADGTVLFEDGEDGQHFYVLLAGGLVISKEVNGETHVMSRHSARADDARSDPDDKPAAATQYTGELPMLAGGGYVARATAAGRTEVLAYDKATFFGMLARCPQVCQVLLPVLAWRIRSYERRSGRSVMLEGLGALAAGLAHELNNPTSAVLRAGHMLADSVSALAQWAVRWGSEATPAERAAVASLGNPGCAAKDPLAAADAAERLAALMAAHGVAQAAELAFTLDDWGVTAEALSALQLRAEAFEPAVAFLAYSAQARQLAGEVAEGGERIESLVRSVKGYTNVGRAHLGDVRLAEGLESTLRVLSRRLAGIQVQREYADLPPVPGYPSELNQVWTNLIENAADAMGGSGDLHVGTSREGDWAVVEIRDSGPGISPEVLPRLFQPFFTTKDIGKGTGLGLHLSRDIVVHRHNGHIDVSSVPGDTRFRVRLPMHGE
jgi:signal transduction histidine kinase